MQPALRGVRHSPATTPYRIRCQLLSSNGLDKTRIRHAATPSLPYCASGLSTSPILSSRAGPRDRPQAAKVTGSSADGKLAKDGKHNSQSQQTQPDSQSDIAAEVRQIISNFIRDGAEGRWPDQGQSWKQLLLSIQNAHGDEGVCEAYLEIQSRGLLRLVTDSRFAITPDFFGTPLARNGRVTELFDFATQLRKDQRFVWPHFYTKILSFYLEQGDFDNAFLWHMRLTPSFSPDAETFGALLASLGADPSPQMQSTLTSMYVFSVHRNLYDYIVPGLFEAGHSDVARQWRKKLLTFNDVPKTAKARPFIQFMTCYYPKQPLAREEIAVLTMDRTQGARQRRTSEHPAGYAEMFTAQWLATSWTSAEFAIGIAHKLGLRSIGPRSLHAIANREPKIEDIAQRIAQLGKLNIKIQSHPWSRALVSFVEKRDQELLSTLLQYATPEDFDSENLRALKADFVKQNNRQHQRLLEAVEQVVQDRSHGKQLNSFLWATMREGDRRSIGKARLVLDRMETMNVKIHEKNASYLLKAIFRNLTYHPGRAKQRRTPGGLRVDSDLDRAIDVTLKLARQGIAIQNTYWTILLCNLGRLSRFEELEKLSLQIVQLFKPESDGLIPVDSADMPQTPKQLNVLRMDVILASNANASQGGPEVDSRAPRSLDVPNASHGSRYSETFWKAEMGGHYKTPATRLREEEEERRRQRSLRSPYSEDFLRAEIGDKYQEAGPVSAALRTPNPLADKWASAKLRDHGRQYIPADLTLKHRQHPIQLLFSTRMQRYFVRWGFNQTLKERPTDISLMDGQTHLGPTTFDLACGVRILAVLRDAGVLIDRQVVVSCLYNCIALATVPGRKRHRARDGQELAPERLKTLIDRAWGSELLPELPKVLEELDRVKPQLFKRYPTLFQKSYDSGPKGLVDFDEDGQLIELELNEENKDRGKDDEDRLDSITWQELEKELDRYISTSENV